MMLRITTEISPEDKKIVAEIAEKHKWSFSKTVSVLLHNAIKERIRKKSKKPEDNS